MFRIRYFVISLVFFIFSWAGIADASEIEAPTINYEKNVIYNLEEITVTGTTSLANNILIYLDGTYVDLLESKEKVGSFIYTYTFHTEEIKSGLHELTFVSQDKTSLVLSPPKIWEFSLVDEVPTSSVPAPTLFLENDVYVTEDSEIELLGLSKSSTRVQLYLNGKIIYFSELLVHESGTANFHYILNDLLKGVHELSVLAVDSLGNQSIANKINIFVEAPMPAPTLLSLENNVLKGLAKNDSTIQIIVDRNVVNEFKVNNHESGTTGFVVNIDNEIYSSVYAIAFDKRGKKSRLSNSPAVVLPEEYNLKPSISEEAVSEIQDNIEIEPNEKEIVPSETLEETKDVEIIDPDEDTTQVEDKEDKDKEIANLFEDLKKEASKESGSVDETKMQQGRLQLNLLIFILFLFGVIAWIFWVNRELIKERKELNELEKKSKDT